jgi:hypothetical protein
MKHPKPASTKPDDGPQVELGRLRAMHHVHDAARILTDATPYVEPDRRLAYTAIVVGVTNMERHLTDLLAPKS